MNYEEFSKYVKDKGITQARTDTDFIFLQNGRDHLIPKGTLLWFGMSRGLISTFNHCTINMNKQFSYNFNYERTEGWMDRYRGRFMLECQNIYLKQLYYNIKNICL